MLEGNNGNRLIHCVHRKVYVSNLPCFFPLEASTRPSMWAGSRGRLAAWSLGRRRFLSANHQVAYSPSLPPPNRGVRRSLGHRRSYELRTSPLMGRLWNRLSLFNREDRIKGPGNLAAGKILDTDKSGYIGLNMFLTLLFRVQFCLVMAL